MTRKDAVDTLVALAVCSTEALHCDTDCPFYNEATQLNPAEYKYHCSDAWTNATISEAVAVLREQENE